MIVVAIFLSLAILPTARAADETVWASDDPVENYCTAVDAVVKVYSADALKQDNPALLQQMSQIQGWCANPSLREILLKRTLCRQAKSIVVILTSESQSLIFRGVFNPNFRVPVEVVGQIGIGIAFALRVVAALRAVDVDDCDFSVSCYSDCVKSR